MKGGCGGPGGHPSPERSGGPPLAIAVVGPTATGKSALGLALAERIGGEIVSCDSTAVYRGFDIGTDKVPPAERRGITHHLLDIVDPTEQYSAARFAEEAARVFREISARGRLPIVVGGTGLYYRALVRGLFPGPAGQPDLRARLTRVAGRGGAPRLHRWLSRVDPESGRRIQPRDTKRLVRALEVYYLTGRALSEHFASTRSPIEEYAFRAVALRLPAETLAARVARRVDAQFAAGLIGEVRSLLARGVPPEAPPFGGLVYRQVLEHLRGARDLEATRSLIVRENCRYARRQLIWFRREPDLIWIDAAGEHPETTQAAIRGLRLDACDE